jgi:hypothetical protein
VLHLHQLQQSSNCIQLAQLSRPSLKARYPGVTEAQKMALYTACEHDDTSNSISMNSMTVAIRSRLVNHELCERMPTLTASTAAAGRMCCGGGVNCCRLPSGE